MRLFVAYEITEEIRARCAELQAQLKPRMGRVTWTQPKNLHMTLKFLGEVPDADVPNVAGELKEAAMESESFEIEYTGVSAFPTVVRPRVVIVQSAQTPAAVSRLHESIEIRMAALGFEQENRPLHPHLTLGRVKEMPKDRDASRAALAALSSAPVGRHRVTEIVLFQSTLTPSGSIYTARVREVLGSGSGADRKGGTNGDTEEGG